MDELSTNPPKSATSLMQGLLEAGSATPPSSRRTSSYDSDEEIDERVQKRISLVESRLLEIVNQSELHDHHSSTSEIDIFDHPILPIHQPHAYPCADTYNALPASPSKWPQAPIMLRPTPGSNMIIRGIRYASSKEYQSFPGTCAGCILPVNNGQEPPGKSLVIDFESPLFCGTLLMRVAGAPSVDDTVKQSETSYFDGKKRRFQVVVKGRFRVPDIPMSECVTGQVFDRASGKLPARFIVNAFVKFISTLAPQLEAELDGDRPRFLTPLVATAHTVMTIQHHERSVEDDEIPVFSLKKVNFSIYAGSENMEEEVEEPPSDHVSSVMSTVNASESATGICSLAKRRGARKKAFNQVASEQRDTPTFDTSKEYTFEFFQHLLLLTEPEDFKINMGKLHVGLAQPLNGQPIKILAARKTHNKDLLSSVLWSFDLWHTALFPYAKAASDRTS